MYIGIAGLLLAVIGLAARAYPIYLDQYDVYGTKVSCGNGLSSDLRKKPHPPDPNLISSNWTVLAV